MNMDNMKNYDKLEVCRRYKHTLATAKIVEGGMGKQQVTIAYFSLFFTESIG